MNSTKIHNQIARAVRACYLDKNQDRRISIRELRKAAEKPNSAEGIADTITEARGYLDSLKADGIITWYGVFNLNADGPQWIKFQLPPFYARSPTVPAALDSVADAQ
jgi:hypothetical protein